MAEGKAQVNTWDGLNVRAGAGTSYSKLGALVNGTQVTYYSDSNGWLQINYNGQTGYICKQYTNITQALSSGGSSEQSSSGGSSGAASSSSSGSAGTVKVTADVLNVRMGNSTSYGIIGTLTYGKVISYSEEKGGWLKINYGGQEGWICKDWTTPASSEQNASQENSGGGTSSGGTSSGGETASGDKATTMYTTADVLNVRQGPGTGYGIVGTLNYGSEISVLGTESNGWKKISFNGGVAYVSGDYVTDKKQSSGGGGSSGGTVPSGDNPAKFAENYLYDTTKLYTHDFITHSPILPYLQDLSWYGPSNGGYDLNCANFVTACLQNCGWLNFHDNTVEGVYYALRSGSNGYREVDRSQAKPGDVWCNSSLGHTELVYSNSGGNVTLIGSNNANTNYQRVTKDTWSGGSGHFLSRQ